jgi:uncharacterized membrane protein
MAGTTPETPISHPQDAGWAGRYRRLRIALIASLGVNLLVLGTVAGAVFLGPGDGPRRFEVRDIGFGPFDRALTREDRDALRQAFVDRAGTMRDGWRQMRADLELFLTILRVEPFDPAALQAVAELQADRMQERFALGQDLLMQRIVAMTEAERLAFADRLEEALRRPRGPDQNGP